jgi:hypothetical protein
MKSGEGSANLLAGPSDDVASVVIRERWARDGCRWDAMLECFHEDALVDISWVRASGPEFVERSRASFAAGVRSVHVHGPVMVECVGDRATADFAALVEIQVELQGTLCALSVFHRLVERVERRNSGGWRIAELRGVYQLDKLVPIIPGTALTINPERLARYRPSYRMLSHLVAETQGEDAVRQDLPGIDRPDLTDALYEANTQWLHGEG